MTIQKIVRKMIGKIKSLLKKLFVKLILLIPRKRDEGELKIQFGVKPDPDDKRDYKSEYLTFAIPDELPEKFSLNINPRDYVKSQGSWNSCASHAMCTAVEIIHKLNGTKYQVPLSERFHYWIARQDEFQGNNYQGGFPGNVGMYSRNMLKVAQRIGLTPEKLCPYIFDKMNETPGQFAFGFADLFKIKFYFRVNDQYFPENDIDNAKKVLVSGRPILIGSAVTYSFYQSSGGIAKDEIKTYGGHEYVIYGYDDEKEEFLCINSWGQNYKDGGLMRVPYNYWKRHGYDMWTVEVSG